MNASHRPGCSTAATTDSLPDAGHDVRPPAPSKVNRGSGRGSTRPSDNEYLLQSLGTTALARVEIDADHYGFPADTGRDAAVATIVDWLRC